MKKFIFVTGGVVSGLGKGISAASIGRLLKDRGIRISAQKMDPYINVDPGTMSPIQHGEVFVTEDGAETDLDLGHYERFMDENLNMYSNVTTGKVYWNVLHKEREGRYLGETVQVIPHITDEIKQFIYSAQEKSKADVLICEIGGTVGDMESQPYLEAISQIAQEQGKENCLFVHVTLVPLLKSSDEFKTKPTQHSVTELQSYGIIPDLIILRCEQKLPMSIIEKISAFCHIDARCVMENVNCASLYEVPLMLEQQQIAEIICEKLSLPKQQVSSLEWQTMVERIQQIHQTIRIAIVGKYVTLHDAYLSIVEALHHGGYVHDRSIDIVWIDSESVQADTISSFMQDVHGILIPGGFGDRGIEGKILAANYARIHRIPYLGICLGMQVAAIAFARDVLHLKDANSYEFDPESHHLIIDFMEDQKSIRKKGGTMRLGAYPCDAKTGSQFAQAYGCTSISERHRHRYEFNNAYRRLFEEHGMDIVGTSMQDTLVEAIEYIHHPFYIGVQFHPELKSRPNRPHPLFVKFIEAACLHQK